MRILVLTHEYPPVGGGGGRVAQDLCEGLAQRGHSLHVLTAHWGNLGELEQHPNLTIQRLRSWRKQSFRADLRAMLGYVVVSVRAGHRIVRKWKPDLIHVHFAVPAGASAWLLRFLTRTPYVLTAHLGDVPGGAPEKTSKWFRWVFPFTPPIWKSAAHVVAVSEFTRGLAHKKYPVEIDVIPNGVDLDQVRPAGFVVGTPPNIVFAGRFVPQKNPLQIVRTLSALKDLPWKCTLIGDGELRPIVEEEISRNGLQDRFELTGWVTPEEVLARFARSDILFMPSRSEGLPVVGVQALASGLVMVLGRAGGNLELVREGSNGYLVMPEDLEGFKDVLRCLLGDRHLILSLRQASLDYAKKFDMTAVLDRYETVLLKNLK